MKSYYRVHFHYEGKSHVLENLQFSPCFNVFRLADYAWIWRVEETGLMTLLGKKYPFSIRS